MSSYKAEVNALLKQRGMASLPTFSGASTSALLPQSDGSSYLKVGGAFLIVAIVILLVLLVVHNTITPIFKVKRNGKGFIPVPGMGQSDDGEVYWLKVPHPADLAETDTIFDGPAPINSTTPGQSSTMNFSLSIDFYFNNLNAGTNANNKNRKLFCRYNPNSSRNSDPSSGLEYSILMELDSQKNDMYITFRSRDTIVITLKNIVPMRPIRVGVVVSEKYVEVYRDGKLVKTTTLLNPILTWRGSFWGDPGGEPTFMSGGAITRTTSDSIFNQPPEPADTSTCPQAPPSGPLGVVYNLHLWRRVVSPEDMRDALPRLLTAEEYAVQRLEESDLTKGINKYVSRIRGAINRNINAASTALDEYGTRVGQAANVLAGGGTTP